MDSTRIRTSIAIATICLTLALHAPLARADAIDDSIRTEMENQRIPGTALAVIRDGKLLKARGYGVSNVELNTPVTPDTVFKIGSVSKQFIATAVMLLVADGKVALADSPRKYLDDSPETWQPITIAQLLSHTAGLVRESPGFESLKLKSDADVIRDAYKAPLNAPPGTKWDYSNLGYFILAEIVHRASGKSWPDFLQERLFKPLGMTTTRTTDLTALVSQRANGYIYRDNELTNAPPIIALRPSGALLSSLNDLIKWDAALSDGAVPARPLVQQMWTPVRFLDGSLAGAKPASYGYGWVIDEYGGHRRIRHGGSLPGFRAEYVRFVDERLDIIVLTNGDGARPDLMAVEVASHFIPGLLPKRKLAKLSAATLASCAGRYERAPDNVLAIGVDGSGLSIQGERGGPQMRLTPESDGVFYISRDETYEFVRENGAVVRLDIRSPDRSFTAKRLP